MSAKIINSLFSVAGAILLGIAVYAFYTYAYNRGMDKVQTEWNYEKQETQKQVELLKQTYYQKELQYQKDINTLNIEIINANKKYSEDIAFLSGSFNDRLRESEQRADIYKHKAESGTTESRNLGELAAKLDRQLTEGINLVKELTGIIELRDRQINTLLEYLNAEKKLNE